MGWDGVDWVRAWEGGWGEMGRQWMRLTPVLLGSGVSARTGPRNSGLIAVKKIVPTPCSSASTFSVSAGEAM